jgi:Polyketide cyclase / dehydrase and lipid transport
VAGFTAVIPSPADVDTTWRRITDWPAHGRWVPLTRVTVLTPSPGGVGARFVGRTGIGPLGFDDPMEVVEWREPAAGVPGRCRVVKQGRVVLGDAWFEVSEGGAGTSTVTWSEQIELAPVRLTRPFGRLIGSVARVAFSRGLRAMARELGDELAREHRA